jgi:hypothetical protein
MMWTNGRSAPRFDTRSKHERNALTAWTPAARRGCPGGPTLRSTTDTGVVRKDAVCGVKKPDRSAPRKDIFRAQHGHQWKCSLERFVHPKIGYLPVAAIDKPLASERP